jgi:hypothetical protein
MENRNQLLAIGRKTLDEEELPEILTTIPEPKEETTDDEQQQEDNHNTAEIAKRIEKIRSKYDTNDINVSMDQPWETMEENAKTMKEIITKMRNRLTRAGNITRLPNSSKPLGDGGISLIRALTRR